MAEHNGKDLTSNQIEKTMSDSDIAVERLAQHKHTQKY